MMLLWRPTVFNNYLVYSYKVSYFNYIKFL